LPLGVFSAELFSDFEGDTAWVLGVMPVAINNAQDTTMPDTRIFS
jgi:hypothetical protein